MQMTQDAAVGFLTISREVFAPLYPYYAGRFLKHSGIRHGRCLDLGCGNGSLGLAVADRSELSVILLDQSPVMARAAGEHAAERGLSHRTATVTADVHDLPLADGCADLIVSRGSLMFWQGLPLAFASVYRVLSPHGRAYLGGGLGSPELRRQICQEMAKRDARWTADSPPPPKPGTDPDRHAAALREAGITTFFITREDAGHWIEIWKAA